MSEGAHKKFTDLHTWQQGRALRLDIYELVKLFPAEEKYRLTDQVTRSVRSICANIAEGHGRFTYKDQLHFCIQARGSLSETHNHLIDAHDCKYIDTETLKNFEDKIQIEKLLNGYIAFLRNTGTPTKSVNG